MKDMQHLQVLDLHIGNVNVQKTDDLGSFLVKGKTIAISTNNIVTTKLICQVLEGLPTCLQNEVSSRDFGF